MYFSTTKFWQPLFYLIRRYWPGIAALTALLFACSDITYSRQQVDILVLGIDKELKEQVQAYLGNSQLDTLDDLPDEIDRIVETAEKSLKALGHYNAVAVANSASYKKDTVIELSIDAGIPTVIKKINLSVTGDAAENREFQKLIGLLPIKTGSILNHGDYERSKDMLHSTARNLGFFDARFLRSQILVTRKTASAEIFIEFDSGARHHINDVKYNTTLFDKPFLERWQPFEADTPYRASHALQLTQNLQNSGYFKFVRVRPETDLISNNTLPLIVELEPAKENVMSLGIGYATDSGIRVKGSWLRPHHNDRGHILKGSSSISRLRQEVSATYQIPHRKSPASGKYTFDFGILNHRTDDTYSQLRTINMTDQRLTRHGWYRDVFVRLENENTDDNTDRTNLLLPGISFSRTKTSGGLRPDKGTFYSFKLLGGSERLLSDINMLRATASAKKLVSWQKRHSLIARADLGILKTQNFSRIPTSHRFFAGGDNSVRGFAYQSISPLNADDEATGGKFLTTASLEYNFYIRDRWALATFVDTGRAYLDSDAPYKVGIGGGIRWLSPVGPLRIDLGLGISEETKPLRLHLAIGPQL